MVETITLPLGIKFEDTSTLDFNNPPGLSLRSNMSPFIPLLFKFLRVLLKFSVVFSSNMLMDI